METKEQREQRLAREIATYSYNWYLTGDNSQWSSSGYGSPIPRREKISTVSDKLRRLPIK